MLVVHVISNLGSGGAEASLYQLVKNNPDDRQIVVSMRDHGVYGKKLESLGIEVQTLGMSAGKLSLSGLIKLVRLIRRTRPNVIQTWMYHADLTGGVAARLALNSHVCWGIHHSNLDRRANSGALLLVVKMCAALSWFVPRRIVSCSERSMQVHQNKRYRKAIFKVIPNGYDLQRFVYEETPRRAWRASLNATDECLLGMVGRWHPQKDHANLINAVALHNETAHTPLRCVLVGEGMAESNPELMSALDNAGARDYFILLGSTDNVPGVMCGIDIHLLSSRGEAFPNVVAEAMACQTPCVVTDVGDAALIVGNTGWVVPPESSADLAKAIALAHTAMQDQVAWQGRRKQCRERIVSEYEISQIVQRYRQLWQEVAGVR